ncbi:DNA helicase B [Discoglossus pictus]
MYKRSSRNVSSLEVLKGRLLPVKDEQWDDDKSEDEDQRTEEPEFLDAEEIMSGGMMVKSETLRNTRVNIEDEISRTYRVTGFFPMVDPWWTVRVEVKRNASQYYTRGYPSYALVNDNLSGDKIGILSLFLTSCNVNDSMKQQFLEWLPNTPVTFQNLQSLLEDYEEETHFNLLTYITRSGPGVLAMKALELPLVMQFLPKLLPRHVRSLLIQGPEKNKRMDPHGCDDPTHYEKLVLIENMLDSEPWKLGFGKIVSEELGLLCCEATWTNFIQCEPLLEKMSDLHIHALIIYNTLKRKCMELGDTYVEQTALCNAVSVDMSDVNTWEALKFLKDIEVVVLDGQRVILSSFYRYENDIAHYIHELVNRESWVLDIDAKDALVGTERHTETEQKDKINGTNCNPPEADKDASKDCMEKLEMSEAPACTEHPNPTVFDADQLKAAKMICANPVTVISGKGGCGKTTVVSLVFKHLMKKEKEEVDEACRAFESDLNASSEWEWDSVVPKENSSECVRVLLTAPTGKAASLLKKKTALPAATLHQITCSYSRFRKNKESNEPWKFSKVEVLVVDEGSLVSVHIFSSALKLLFDHSKLSKLIILGDVRQLPSIEPGNLLADMFRSLDRMGWAVELRTNHRAESQLIVDNAARISQQNCPEFDSVIHIHDGSNIEMPSEDKKFVFVSLPDDGTDFDLQTAINILLEKGPGLNDDKHSQFIAFRRRDCSLINDLCCKYYSGHITKNHKGKLLFQCKDKVCCTRNAYLKDLLPKSEVKDGEEQKEDERLCNGEIFFINDDVERDRIRVLTIGDVEGREYTLDYKKLRTECDLRHAWARTIHTFQGSEEDTVVYVMGTAGRQNWKHVYTAITRGRKRVYIVATKNHLDQAISNHCRNRKTRLQQCLKEKLLKRSYTGSSPPTTQHHPHNIVNEVFQGKNSENGKLYVQPPLPCPLVYSKYDVGDTSECVDHRAHTVANISSEHSPCRRQGAFPVDPETPSPSKISRTETSKDPKVSPLGCTDFHNLRIKSPISKALFKP